MKTIAHKFGILFIILYFISCSKNPIENEFTHEPEYWSAPQDDATILYFRDYNTLVVDSTIAGNIQFALSCARTVNDTLDEIVPLPSWVLGELILGVTDEMWDEFDTQTYRFNKEQIDSLLNHYCVISGEKKGTRLGSRYVKLKFTIIYNIPILAGYFRDIPGVTHSGANHVGTLPEGSMYDIWLEMVENRYIFTFKITTYTENKRTYWEVLVSGNHAEFIRRWQVFW